MIHIMLLICFIILICVLFSNIIKFLLRFFINAGFGYILFTILNTIGLSIGGNLVTFLLSGFLGLPGIFCILTINAII